LLRPDTSEYKGNELVIVLLQLKVGPEKRFHILKTVHAITGPAKAQAGCQLCELYSNTQNDDELALLQVWDSQENLEDHIRSEEFRNVLAVMDNASIPPKISFNAIESVRNFDLVEDILGADN
jgi:quinol monooxygenase YgiN